MEFNLDSLVRDNIKKMTAYSSARHEFTGNASIYLDANENSFGSPLPDNFNRYPDPLQMQVKEKLSKIKGVPVQNIFLAMEVMKQLIFCIASFVSRVVIIR
jgi:histidinol-phosphate aminotransferase